MIDSQSVKAVDGGGLHGYDGGKKVNGVKRHLLVDTLGTVVSACVSPANVDDREGAKVVLCTLGEKLRRLRHVWADAGYRGGFLDWARRTVGVTVQVVTRRDGGRTWAPVDAPPPPVPRFAVVPRRWGVERTFAWLGKYRRLSKDYEYDIDTSENTIYLAVIMILLHHPGSAPN